MQGRFFTFERPTNPLLQALYLLAGGVLLVGALVMGAVIVAVGLSFALVIGLVVWIRLWWLNRKMGRAGPRGAGARPGMRIGLELRPRSPLPAHGLGCSAAACSRVRKLYW